MPKAKGEKARVKKQLAERQAYVVERFGEEINEAVTLLCKKLAEEGYGPFHFWYLRLTWNLFIGGGLFRYQVKISER